jgi:hypothetical protein
LNPARGSDTLAIAVEAGVGNPKVDPRDHSVEQVASFALAATEVIERIRATFVAVIEAVCGCSPRAQDVSEQFGIHRKLGWQVWNVAYAAEPLTAVRFMPSERSMKVWREAAERRGVSSELLARLDDAPASFDRLVATHAADRETFEMLAESCDPRVDAAAELRWRKQAFAGNCFVWGVRAKTLLACAFLHPAEKVGFFDLVRVQGLIGMIRTRPGVRWPFAQSLIETGDGAQRRPRREALTLSAEAEAAGVPLMAGFCSRPLPAVQRRLAPSGMLEDELLPGRVGQTGECTIVTGEILRNAAPAYRTDPEESEALFGTGVRTPGEMLICDQFVHRSLFPTTQHELRVFSELISPTTRDVRDLLPVSESVQRLGRGTARVRTADVPQYGELIECVFSRTGWDADEFDVYRVRMRYPPIPTSVMIRYDLGPPPEGMEFAGN